MEGSKKVPPDRLSVNDPDFRVPDDDLAFLDESPPPRPLNAAAVVAEARRMIESWDETTPIAVAQVDAYIILNFLSRIVNRAAHPMERAA